MVLQETLSTAHNQLAWMELIKDSDNEIQIALSQPITQSK